MNVRKNSFLKEFQCMNGKTYYAHKNSCLFCNHCSDIIFDFTNGPYMFMCDLYLDETNVDKSFEGKCDKWEGDDEE